MKPYRTLHKPIDNTVLTEWVIFSWNKNILQKIIANALATCFLLIPESIDLAIKQQRQEHLTTRIMDPVYLKQAWVESLQWIYEHIHFLWWPIPKGIELYKQQWSISKTPCPQYTPWRYGRFFLAWTDAMKWRYTYTMAYKLLWTELTIIELLGNNMVHNSLLMITLPFSSVVYYLIVKNSDIYYAQEQIYKEKITKLWENK